MKNYKIYWTPNAVNDMLNILEKMYEINSNKTVKFYYEIKHKCKKLESIAGNNELIPELKQIGLKNFYQFTHENYKIIYRLYNRDVNIIACLDTAKEYETILYERITRIRMGE